MAVTGGKPISSDSLAAALDAGGGASDTGGKPLSVDNLRAVLGSGGVAKVDLIYEGSIVDDREVSISYDGDYDAIVATGTANGEPCALLSVPVATDSDYARAMGQMRVNDTDGSGNSDYTIATMNGTVTIMGQSYNEKDIAEITKVYGIKL